MMSNETILIILKHVAARSEEQTEKGGTSETKTMTAKHHVAFYG